MTAIEGTYTVLVDARGMLRLQMHGAPRSVYVGGVAEVESTGDIVLVPLTPSAPGSSGSKQSEDTSP